MKKNLLVKSMIASAIMMASIGGIVANAAPTSAAELNQSGRRTVTVSVYFHGSQDIPSSYFHTEKDSRGDWAGSLKRISLVPEGTGYRATYSGLIYLEN